MPCKQVTIKGPSKSNVELSNYTINTDTNSAVVSVDAKNPNPSPVNFETKVTVNGSEKDHKTTRISANSSDTISYKLSFNIGTGKSATPNICIKPVSTIII